MGKRGFVDKHNASGAEKQQKQVDIIEKLGGYDNLVSQGAEGRVFAVKFCGRDTIVKQRFKKTYRHPTLDTKLTRSRLGMEARSMMRARKLGVATPTLYYVDQQQSAIYMEKVPGKSLKELIREDSMSEKDMEDIGAQVGKAVAKMHDGGLIHGDLTTSNILVRDDDERPSDPVPRVRGVDTLQQLALEHDGVRVCQELQESKSVAFRLHCPG